MTTEYYREFSQCLDKDVEMKVYGESGVPILYIVSSEEQHIVRECLIRLANEKIVQVFEIASPLLLLGEVEVSSESSFFIEQFYNHVIHEIVPRVFRINTKSNDGERCSGIYTVGENRISGATVNYFLRRPDIFLGTLSLNGMFDLSEVFGKFMDKYIYDNSPTIYLDNMDENHPYIELYNKFDNIYILNNTTGTTVKSAKTLQEIFAKKKIKADFIFAGETDQKIDKEFVCKCLTKLISNDDGHSGK